MSETTDGTKNQNPAPARRRVDPADKATLDEFVLRQVVSKLDGVSITNIGDFDQLVREAVEEGIAYVKARRLWRDLESALIR